MIDFPSVHWRKSSHSGGASGQCIEVAQLPRRSWRKSSHSGGEAGQCIEVAQLPERAWRKSTRSGGNSGMCVEVADLTTVIGIRDSKNPDAGHLSLTTEAFADLLTRVKRNELSR
ncbi:DUF397 domain-containing protein [Actinomadura craniellae]|uniref:DUF397 domain-containing protein n=1 Tax=Actinomadura craniellae TaxID=2231787 RepID=A0A365H1V8_9ACTN|nr:DUF397 domain-containing protein [Actinomadura craniellae]RAY12193.1 DUF397 domain-containing protein [Actinomadura craniellae]